MKKITLFVLILILIALLVVGFRALSGKSNDSATGSVDNGVITAQEINEMDSDLSAVTDSSDFSDNALNDLG